MLESVIANYRTLAKVPGRSGVCDARQRAVYCAGPRRRIHAKLIPKWEQTGAKWDTREPAARRNLDGSGAGPRLWRVGEKAMLHSIMVGSVFTAMVLAPCVFALFAKVHD